ncbi:hypothetical protein BT96DRAFT_918303 [Gymnopus androsaceus JB14]|uniref:Uncharacterized protein n=1 Tax=Gymnopus androsaceus JB14 TaxID=1447944 RepID=A0A6A4I001_9AGAR|nr:hypothetical protein BT96DRAFT_918303 [Gymnopus androsaceus JB14]
MYELSKYGFARLVPEREFSQPKFCQLWRIMGTVAAFMVLAPSSVFLLLPLSTSCELMFSVP